MAGAVLVIMALNLAILGWIGFTVRKPKKLILISFGWTIFWPLVGVLATNTFESTLTHTPISVLFINFALKLAFNTAVLFAGKGLGHLADHMGSKKPRAVAQEISGDLSDAGATRSLSESPAEGQEIAPPERPQLAADTAHKKTELEAGILGFKDPRLGWVFVAGAVALIVWSLSQGQAVRDWLHYRASIDGPILALSAPIVLYAIMRALESGRSTRQ